MAYTASSAATSAAYAQAQAIKASGAIVKMEPQEFQKLIDKMKEALIVTAVGGVINKNYQYLVGYKGLMFFTKSSSELLLPSGAELVAAKSIAIPD